MKTNFIKWGLGIGDWAQSPFTHKLNYLMMKYKINKINIKFKFYKLNN